MIHKNNNINIILPRVEYVILIGFVIRVFCSFINSYIQVLPGADMDAETFHNSAVGFSVGQEYFNNTFGQGKLYVIILGTVYKVLPTNYELFAGGTLSCIAWYISAIVLIKIFRLTNFNKFYETIGLLIYSFLPFGIILTSITIREPFQLLFINLVIYYLLIVMREKTLQNIFNLVLVSFILFFFHQSFYFLLIFIFLILFLNTFVENISNFFNNNKFVIIILFITLSYIYLPYYTDIYTYLVNDVQHYKFNHEQWARSLYKDQIEVTYEKKYFLLSLLYNFIQFEFEPFPWRETIIRDNILIIQNLLKLVLFYFIFKKFILSVKEKNLTYISIFSIFIFLELLWSAGTVNWGTAVRHQVPGYGMLVFLSFVNLKKIK